MKKEDKHVRSFCGGDTQFSVYDEDNKAYTGCVSVKLAENEIGLPINCPVLKITFDLGGSGKPFIADNFEGKDRRAVSITALNSVGVEALQKEIIYAADHIRNQLGITTQNDPNDLNTALSLINQIFKAYHGSLYGDPETFVRAPKGLPHNWINLACTLLSKYKVNL